MCVFITDAPPHGLATEGCSDSFPNGCPDGLDPMEIVKQLSGEGVSLYVVGCEPSVSPYKDFYLALAHVTGGQYVPLSDAKGLVKIIIFGSREEMSLKKFEAEVEEEIKVLKSSGIAINEENIFLSLHERWKLRGEKSKQLMLNQQRLETAENSANAMAMAKASFVDVRNLFSTSQRDPKSVSGHQDNSKAEESTGEALTEEMDTKAKIDMATAALAELKTKSLSGDWVKVGTSGLAETIDFGPAEGKMESTDEGSEYQCIDGGVTLSQTMRVVQKSMMKLSKSGKSDK